MPTMTLKGVASSNATTTARRMEVLGIAGNGGIHWDTADPATVESARAAFDELIRGGRLTAFSTSSPDAPAEHITQFDPEADIVFVAPMAGG